LIRFTGPELWWLLNVAHWAAGLPNATVPVPSGVGGVLLVALAAAGGAVLWRWRWFRVGVGGATVCLIAWSVSALAAPGVVAGL
jgi:competence protein ComEC